MFTTTNWSKTHQTSDSIANLWKKSAQLENLAKSVQFY